MKQRGFTLIELVVVIVILGILAATALPKFVDLSADAETAAIKGVAGGYASAAAINYSGCAVVNNVVTVNKCVQVNSCADVGALVLPTVVLGTTASAANYYLFADLPAATNGASATCSLQKCKTAATCDNTAPNNYVATFAVIGAGN